MSDAQSSHNLTPAEVRRNFSCLVWMGSVFAMGWAEVMVVLQPMLVHYGASNTQIGIVQGVLIASLPGMIVSPWITRRFRYKKRYLFVTDSLYLLPIGVVGIVVWSGGLGSSQQMIGFIVLMFCASQIAAGFGGLPNQEFFSACIPMRLRGRLAGISAGLGGVLGIAATALAAWILDAMPKPQAYGALLVMAWALCQLADSSVLIAREPPTPVEKSPKPWRGEMWRAFVGDRQFLRVACVICLASPLLGQLAIFASVYGFRELGFDPSMAAWLGMLAAGTRLVLSPLGGWATDLWGARRALPFWMGWVALGFFILAVFPGKASVAISTALAAVAWSGFSGAMNALTSGIPKPEHRAGHFTLLGFAMIACNSLGPVLVGRMFDALSYPAGFAILATLVSLLVAFAIYLLRDLSHRAEDYQ
ncbi:MAG: MFS transporter [Luteolibacter sp.]